jgi:ribosomal protein S12 methylthiotransferase
MPGRNSNLAKVSLVSLGCPKNLVDSEGVLGEIVQAGHRLVTDKSQADVIVVNTCGFIESARAESVEAILDAVEHKKAGNCRAVVVIGCLTQRFARELAEELPEVDAFLGTDHTGKIANVIESALSGRRTVEECGPPRKWIEHKERVLSTPRWTAYVKISDGCDNRCSYCTIPDIRGPFRSRPEEYIIDESKRLADLGVRELILVGQDLTKYGEDYGRPNALPDLLEKINAVEGLRWIRILYCYPTRITPELIDAISGLDKVVKYIDIPFQHGDDAVLKAMNRRGTSADYLRLIDALREKIPDIALRTSFIVGFPGETEAAFDGLIRFLDRIQFDRVGVFTYSREEGTPAASMKPRVSPRIAATRRDRLMRAQQAISSAKNRRFIGKTLEILVEGHTKHGVFGRSYRDAPEIDGLVYVNESYVDPGQFVRVKITAANEYDLVGVISSVN